MDDPKPATIQPRSCRILIVDDEEPNRDVLQELVGLAGHEIDLTTDGAEALEKVKSFRPDLVLLDVTMPRMDGFEVCRRLNRDPETASIPVLLVTALTERQDRLEVRED